MSLGAGGLGVGGPSSSSSSVSVPLPDRLKLSTGSVGVGKSRQRPSDAESSRPPSSEGSRTASYSNSQPLFDVSVVSPNSRLRGYRHSVVPDTHPHPLLHVRMRFPPMRGLLLHWLLLFCRAHQSSPGAQAYLLIWVPASGTYLQPVQQDILSQASRAVRMSFVDPKMYGSLSSISKQNKS